MGQYFIFVNLDKGTYRTLGKLGESWADWWTAYLQTGGRNRDRVICIGDYAEYFPHQVLTEDEYSQYILSGMSPYKWVSQTVGGRCVDSSLRSTKYKERVLVNISQREYVRDDFFTDYGQSKYWHPSLNQAVIARIVWSQDDSMSLTGPRLWNFGSWAGSRLTVGKLENYSKDTGYKDITEVVFYEVFTVWAEVEGIAHSCDCSLCEKWREMKQDGFDPYKEPSNDAKSDPAIIVDDEVPRTSQAGSNSPLADSPSDRFYRPRFFPLDIQYHIFAQLDISTLAACALVCQAFVHEANQALYRNVSITTSEHTNQLLDTLVRDPAKKRCIRRLEIQLGLDAAVRQASHEILKQLPSLEHLTFLPCWMSYGQLENHLEEYPFKLRSLLWGLIPDRSMLLFLRSQSSILELELPPGYEPLSDWFRFWPSLLPNLQRATAEASMLRALRALKCAHE
ncbi:hypothetical protein FRB91_005061 [Serendipita sp. 411]|nr:hypothetical protein FRC19_003071 [Serendipita sp. 401]KAG8841383.1 hypothetical protein FRB91_005061 [Serendipita sp. 411]KAG9025579.1 hypothetical protein FS842_005218 [Serendipita sp. 407]